MQPLPEKIAGVLSDKAIPYFGNGSYTSYLSWYVGTIIGMVNIIPCMCTALSGAASRWLATYLAYIEWIIDAIN